MKKIKYFFAITAVAAMLAGCGEKEIPMEDYDRGNPQSDFDIVMKTDSGYFYNSLYYRHSLHYFDTQSGQNIYLCSRPECKHDGNEFCTATNGRYTVGGTYLYGDRIYISALERKDSQYQYKLLSASPDGTELKEEVTFLTVSDTGMTPLQGGNRRLMIHRGVVVLPYQMWNLDNDDIGVNGTILYNLKTKELATLGEHTKEESEEGETRFCGYGDYIYYNTKIGRKNILSRYCLTDGSVEDMKLMVAYSGVYEVMSEDSIYYTRSGPDLYEYHPSTGETITHKMPFMYQLPAKGADGELFYMSQCFEASDLMTDGTYLYVGRNVKMHRSSYDLVVQYQNGEETMDDIQSVIHVYDHDWKEIATVPISTQKYFGARKLFTFNVLGEDVYLRTAEAMYRCTKESFLSGEPEFEELFRFLDTNIYEAIP